jgi:hypothetical protein
LPKRIDQRKKSGRKIPFLARRLFKKELRGKSVMRAEKGENDRKKERKREKEKMRERAREIN